MIVGIAPPWGILCHGPELVKPVLCLTPVLARPVGLGDTIAAGYDTMRIAGFHLRRTMLATLLGLVLAACGGTGGGTSVVHLRFIDEDPQVFFDRSDMIASEAVAEWVFRSRDETGEWSLNIEAGEFTPTTTGLHIHPERRFVTLTREVDFEAHEIDAFELRIKGLRRHPVSVEWAGPGEEFIENRRITLDAGQIAPDGFMDHRIVTAGHPKWRKTIARLRFSLNLPRNRKAVVDRVTALTEWMPDDRLTAAVSRPWKVTVGNETRNGLLAVPDAVIRRQFTVPDDARLWLGYGQQPSFSAPVRFLVSATVPGKPRRILMDETTSGTQIGWRDASFDLGDLAGDTVDLELVTEIEGEFDPALGFPVWANPEVLVESGSGEQPNVVLIVLDTLRADHLSLYGHPRKTSPRIDAWAESRGAVFENVVASAPWTLPSHVSMFTGLHAHRHGVNHNFPAPPSLTMLAERLRNAGYSTLAVTGGGFVHARFGFSQGFDSYWSQGVRVGFENELERELGRACSLLEQYRRRPFFLFFHTYEIHNPFRARQPHFSEFSNLPDDIVVDVEHETKSAEDGFVDHRYLVLNKGGEVVGRLEDDQLETVVDLYDAGIAYTDAMIARIFRRLEHLGIDGRTIVILTSDHGEMFGEHGTFNHVTLYEENLLVPLIIVDPDRRGGIRIPEQVRLVDLAPTILDLVDVEGLPDVDGVSLGPLLDGEAPAEGTGPAWSYAAASNYGLSVREKNSAKYVFRNDPWPHDGPMEWFYDLQKDPSELDPNGLPAGLVERYRGLAAQVVEREMPGLVLRLASPESAPSISGQVRGAMVYADRIKTGQTRPAWMDYGPRKEARFRVEGGRTVEAILADVGPTITIRLEPIRQGSPTFELEVDTHRLDGVLQVIPGADGWYEMTADDPAEHGLSLFWKLRPEGGVGSGPVKIDESLKQQLEALGYVH